jgi:transcriptional regulator with XRE-family HTH domain
LSITIIAIVFPIKNKVMDTKISRLREIFSANMRARRKHLGLSQEKLAELIDVTTQTINDIECCRSWLSDKTLEKLARALDMDVYRFFMPGVQEDAPLSVTASLLQLREEIKAELGAHIDACIDGYFKRLLFSEIPPKTDDNS